MITGFLSRWEEEKYLYPKAFDTAFNFIKNNDYHKLPDGKHLISGEDIFMLLSRGNSEAPESRRFEAHVKYLDIQLLFAGREAHWYHPLASKQTALEDKLEKEDIAFYPSPAEPALIVLEPGQYVAYAPGELHKPFCTAPGEEISMLEKVIIKIAKKLL